MKNFCIVLLVALLAVLTTSCADGGLGPISPSSVSTLQSPLASVTSGDTFKAQDAGGNGRWVIGNNGNGSVCEIGYLGRVYKGFSVLRMMDGGVEGFACHAKQTLGDLLEKIFNPKTPDPAGCHWIITPGKSSEADVVCPRGF